MAETTNNRPGGRQKGTPNKTTGRVREAIARAAEANSDKIVEWLDEIHRENGAESAMKLYLQMIEYHIPKLARSEVTGPNGGPIETQHSIDTSKMSDAALTELMQARGSAETQ